MMTAIPIRLTPAVSLLLLCAAQAVAQQAKLGQYVPPETRTFAPSPGFLLLRTLSSLALVVGLVLVTAWLVRLRHGVGSTPATPRLRVIETTTLAPNRTLHLVALGERVLLLGAGSQVTCLGAYTAAEVGYDPADPLPAPSFETIVSRLQWPGRERPEALEEEQ